MMTLPIPLLLLSASWILAPHVAGHGFVKTFLVDGKAYPGNFPFDPKHIVDSPIQFVDTTFPVLGAQNPSLTCGIHAQRAPLVVPADPGSQIQFKWNENRDGNWPHKAGPVLTYMALCEGISCDKFDASKGKWFKIDQQGKRNKDSAEWVQVDAKNGKLFSATIPENLKAGDYLIRHEIIALHNASHEKAAQYYPSCTQVRVGGSGNGVPRPEDLVSFPGAYSDTDPGLFDPDVAHFYVADSKLKTPYQFPGPAVAKLVADSSSSSSSGTEASGSQPTTTQPPRSSSTGKSSCKVKRTEFKRAARKRHHEH